MTVRREARCDHGPLTAALVVLMTLTAHGGCGSRGDRGKGGDSDDLEPYEPVPAVMPRLTASQYRNSMRDLLGSGVPITKLPEDTNPYLFYSIGATTTQLSERSTEAYAKSAAVIADWVFADEERGEALVGCIPDDVDDPCVADFLRDFGFRLFRRPLSEDELEDYLGVVVDTARGDPRQGLRLALYALLQSPQFLYRAELGEPDPEDDSRRVYTSFEMAQRLSFLLWDTTPDRELLEAASADELTTEEGIYSQAVRLLDSERSRMSVQAFFSQYLNLGALRGLERDPELFPAFSPTLAESMRAEVDLLVGEYVFRRDADIRQLFSARRTYVNRELAELYNVEAPGATDIAYVPVKLPADGPRAGFLTSGAFLAMNAHHTVTSPTLRGKYIRQRVLCQEVPPPPDDVDFEIADPSPEARTLRERMEQHVEDPQCAGCHGFLDPPGYLFEGFDAIGAHRTHDNGVEVDTTGELDGEPLQGARDLAELLASDEQVAECLVKQLYRHANGRLDAPGEEAALARLESAFADSGYRFRDLLLALVTSEGFRVVAPQEDSQ